MQPVCVLHVQLWRLDRMMEGECPPKMPPPLPPRALQLSVSQGQVHFSVSPALGDGNKPSRPSSPRAF